MVNISTPDFSIIKFSTMVFGAREKLKVENMGLKLWVEKSGLKYPATF